jgi:hypothetical protein
MRRLVGVAVVLAVLLVGAVASRLTWPGSAGRATATTQVRPAVADCVRTLPGWLFVVPCAQPHVAEVVVVVPVQSSSTDEAFTRVCQSEIEAYTGQPADGVLGPDWVAPFVSVTPGSFSPAAGTSTDASAPDPWRACLVQPAISAGLSYTGTLRGVGGSGAVPAAASVCFRTTGNPTWSAVPCTTPHLGEVVARRAFTVAIDQSFLDVETDPTLLAGCAAEIGARTGLADPTAGGALSVGLSDISANSNFPGDATSIVATVDCTVSVAHGGRLTGSLLGIGDGPLPLG